jgi:hypothetical protein
MLLYYTELCERLKNIKKDQYIVTLQPSPFFPRQELKPPGEIPVTIITDPNGRKVLTEPASINYRNRNLLSII